MTEEQEALSQHSVIAYRVTNLETVMAEVRNAVKSIDASLQSLARLEAKHSEVQDSVSRAFKAIEAHDARVRAVELELPTLRLIRNWVIGGVIGGLSLAAIGLATVISENYEFRVGAKASAATYRAVE